MQPSPRRFAARSYVCGARPRQVTVSRLDQVALHLVAVGRHGALQDAHRDGSSHRSTLTVAYARLTRHPALRMAATPVEPLELLGSARQLGGSPRPESGRNRLADRRLRRKCPTRAYCRSLDEKREPGKGHLRLIRAQMMDPTGHPTASRNAPTARRFRAELDQSRWCDPRHDLEHGVRGTAQPPLGEVAEGRVGVDVLPVGVDGLGRWG
jgi:hypothetical protein